MTVVSALLGHENLQNTAVYLGLKPESLREAVDKLDESLDEGGNKTSVTQKEEDLNMLDHKSLREHVERLTKSYERLSKAEEKKTRDQDSALGLIPIVLPKNNKNLK